MKGKVYLVGAGPGDPELLTVKALRLLQTADAVLHDDLVSPEILQLIPATAQVHNVGKRCGKKKISQEEINFLMVALADSGLRVVRLKSGDPLIFGRAGEEIEALRKAGIPYEIVPGVTSALGAAAAAQIPLTHRRASSALVLHHGASGCRKRSGQLEQARRKRRDARDLHARTELFRNRCQAEGVQGWRPKLRAPSSRAPQPRISERTGRPLPDCAVAPTIAVSDASGCRRSRALRRSRRRWRRNSMTSFREQCSASDRAVQTM